MCIICTADQRSHVQVYIDQYMRQYIKGELFLRAAKSTNEINIPDESKVTCLSTSEIAEIYEEYSITITNVKDSNGCENQFST